MLIFLLAQPKMKIKLTKIFTVTLLYKSPCDTAVLNALLLTRFTTSPHLRCHFKATVRQRMVFQIPKGGCEHLCQRKWSPLQTKWLSSQWLLVNDTSINIAYLPTFTYKAGFHTEGGGDMEFSLKATIPPPPKKTKKKTLK